MAKKTISSSKSRPSRKTSSVSRSKEHIEEQSPLVGSVVRWNKEKQEKEKIPIIEKTIIKILQTELPEHDADDLYSVLKYIADKVTGTQRQMELVEKLADLEHRQWIDWSKNLVNKEPNLSKERIERWQKYWHPYKNLPEDVKDQDRIWVLKSLALSNPKQWDLLLRDFAKDKVLIPNEVTKVKDKYLSEHIDLKKENIKFELLNDTGTQEEINQEVESFIKQYGYVPYSDMETREGDMIKLWVFIRESSDIPWNSEEVEKHVIDDWTWYPGWQEWRH